MATKIDNQYDPNSTPKLTLSKLPLINKPKLEPIQMLTPPLQPSVSIPFRWEEAPGKPRAATEGAAAPPNKVVRCLDLPPRLLQDDGKITIMPSPGSVLDGPYVGRSLSLACTFSFRKGPVLGRDEMLRPIKKGGGGEFGSARWGSFTDEEKLGKGSFGNSHTLGEMFRSDEKNVKITRVKRRRSFFNMSSMNSNLLDIYASFKHAVPIPWRRRR